MRQPIIAVLGHVDHGKTSMLDSIRKTAIATKEAGGITQAIGTTEIPLDIIKTMCSHTLEKFNFEITIPGLLFIDTPGHEAFVTLRKRGGSIADLAILVVDIVEGIMPQTAESLNILKETKTPFIIAVNKIDRLEGWKSEHLCFLENFPSQSEEVRGFFEEKFYKLTEQFKSHGFYVERFDRITDFTKSISAVPLSSKTGEGIPELLVLLAGLSQQFLKQKLEITGKSKGMIMEVRDFTGLGMTIDCVIYDGSVSRNDYLVVGGKTSFISKIKALLVPESLRDMRTEKKFRNTESVTAASGVKISAPGLDLATAGTEIRTAKTMPEAEQLLEELSEEIEEIEIQHEGEGLILKADTVGGMDALINIFRNFHIKEATIGQPTKTDIIKSEANTDRFLKVVICFNLNIPEETENFSKDKGVKIFNSNIIYRLIEDYEKWISEEKESAKKKELSSITKPAKFRILPGCIFRASNPAIVGCEIVGGILRSGSNIMDSEKDVGEVKQIQVQGQNVEEAKPGDKVAVSMIGPTVGRQINENDILFTSLSKDDYLKLTKNKALLTESEKDVLEEIKAIKRKKEPAWGLY